MAKSLQEQLLKSGLTSTAKVKEIKSQKRKQAKQQRQGQVDVVNEARALAEKAKAEKAEKDRLLNLQRQQDAEKKQKIHQIRQLIEPNKLPQDYEKGIQYNFTDHNKVKTLYLSKEIRDQVIKGRAAIVKSEQSYEVIPLAVAQKIEQYDSTFIIVVVNTPEQEKMTDDAYANFPIPDDLVW